MKIVWDLDGVLRDLSGFVSTIQKCPYPTKWDYSYNGKSLYECVGEDPTILSRCPATAYKHVVKNHYEIAEIWTSQPGEWRPYTLEWIEKHMGSEYKVFFLTTEEKEEKLKNSTNTILVEDSPNFKNYDNIILIDRPYNHEIKGVMRVFGAIHLNNLIELLKEK